MKIVLYVAALVGMVCGAGYAGAFLARYRTQSIESHISPPWSSYDRATLIENLGFLCGAAGGMVILLFALAAWWGGNLHLNLD